MTTLTEFNRHRNSNQGELACRRKLIPRRRNITKTPRRAIGLPPNITAKANTPRVSEESTKAQGHSKTAREHSDMAHGKSQSQK